jgi:2-methylcitrate dehydratase PrpD
MSVSLLDRAVTISTALELDQVPPEAIRQAGYVIADTVGVSCAGTRQPEMRGLLELSRAEGTVGDPVGEASGASDPQRAASVLSMPRSASTPAQAAFLNATAGSFLELDEGMRPTGHPAMQMVPAALAVAEARGASGAEVLRAVLAGYEATSRLFRAFRLRYPVHPHGHLGAIGAAVAVALLERTDPVRAARIAGTTPILSVWDACYEGATARNTWMGLAAQSAVRASMLARAGFAGSASALEVAFGQVAGDLVDRDAIEAPLDYSRLGIRSNYFKLHSACALSHAALDAMQQLRAPEARSIESIVVETVSNNMKLNRQPQPNDLSARFSLPYAVATAAILGRTDPEAFSYRPDVAELARRVEVRTAEDLEASWPDSSPARVTLLTADGVQTAQVQNPHGHHAEPVTETELRAKFDSLVDDHARADAWWGRLTGLREVESCSTLFAEAR